MAEGATRTKIPTRTVPFVGSSLAYYNGGIDAIVVNASGCGIPPTMRWAKGSPTARQSANQGADQWMSETPGAQSDFRPSAMAKLRQSAGV